MSAIFDKLNLKDQQEIVIMNAPESFETELALLTGVKVLRNDSETKEVSFALAFCTTQKEVDAISRAMAKKARGDAVLWFAYPKGTSKKYPCNFNRDTGWTVLGKAGFEGVRLVAIDEDWSAMRFRRVEFIESMTRSKSRAMTRKGKAKTSKK